MKLSSSAIITPEKIKEYLLSQRKRNDKSKWLAKAGYTLENWNELETDLRTQILNKDAVYTDTTIYGNIFEIKGVLNGPNGMSLEVCTIWIIEHESESTKFITMYPERK
ncbi:MAG: hypothetical protein M1480_21355 [Bacteroidetes bacterium]|nr:hypothetical protein [Bacteroidota bacterium]